MGVVLLSFNPLFSNSVSAEPDDMSNVFFRMEYYHIEIYDVDCGWMVLDGYVDWNDANHEPDSWCIDVTTDHCGNNSYSGIVPPAHFTDSQGVVTDDTMRSYIIHVFKL